MATNSHNVAAAIRNLQRLSDLFCERREQLAREAGLTVQQWCVLEKISEQHFMPSMFARNRDSSAAAVSKVIRQLLDKGVVAVGVQEHDGRQRRYTLTESGERIVEKLRDSRQRAINAVWNGIHPSQLEQFISFSEDLGDRLETYIKQQRNGSKDDALLDTAFSVCAAVTCTEEPLPDREPVAVITSTNKFID
ncbi:MAG: MarR family winged helix-turn-helix transcriptional regulator [Candidatus Sumerlaeaceae bacterium]